MDGMHHNPWGSFAHTLRRALLLAALVGGTWLAPVHPVTAGLIPGTYPVVSEQELEVKGTVTINGQTVVEGKTNPDAIITIDGQRETVAQVLPALEPPTFPTNNSSTEATDAASPFVHEEEVFYKQVTIREGKSATFTGGGPFHIDKLKLKKDATMHLAQGVYFINALDLGSLLDFILISR